MLEELHIQNVALVDDAWLEFAPGLTVLTGETGAGKTVLMSAIKLLLGQRGDVQTISPNAEELKVEGRFYFGESEFIVSRSLSLTGRNKCLLNGDMVPVKSLADTLASHVDLHGQHDHQTLLKPALHRAILDAYAGDAVNSELATYQKARTSYESLKAELRELQQRAAQDSQALEANRLVLQEILRVDPAPDEDEQLRKALPALIHGEDIAQASDEVWSLMAGENAVGDQLSRALSSVEHVLSFDSNFEPIYKQLSSLLIEAQEIGASMRDYSRSLDRDPRMLDEMQNRLKELESLCKRFGPTLSEVLIKKNQLSELIDSVDNSDMYLAQLSERCEQARKELELAARELHEKRGIIARHFCSELKESLSDLALDNARFEVELKELPFEQWTAHSSDSIEFLYSPVASASPRPLAKIASGGEISRVMLALKTLLGKSDAVSILVFDEIDAGIGGATAQSVGRRLKELARTHQVIVITHLAQVAVYADKHYVVSKSSDAIKVSTDVFEVKDEARVSEVARLLSGETSDLACAHAQELLESVAIP